MGPFSQKIHSFLHILGSTVGRAYLGVEQVASLELACNRERLITMQAAPSKTEDCSTTHFIALTRRFLRNVPATSIVQLPLSLEGPPILLTPRWNYSILRSCVEFPRYRSNCELTRVLRQQSGIKPEMLNTRFHIVGRSFGENNEAYAHTSHSRSPDILCAGAESIPGSSCRPSRIYL